MTLKSFFRKKITKIYLFIIFLIFLIFLVLTFGKNYYIALNNKTYKNSFVVLETEEDIFNKLKKNKNIDSVKNAIYLEDYNISLLEDKNLLDGEILIPEFMKDNVGSELVFSYNNKEYVFNKFKYKDLSNNFIYYISSNDFKKIKDNKNYYIININDWSKQEKIVLKLEKKYNLKNSFVFTDYSGTDYSNMVVIFTIFTILNIVLFVIILLITLYNILEDEKKNSIMYECLGFKKSYIRFNNFIKIVILLISAFILSFIVYSILKITLSFIL